jgi:hypothetical protein
MIVPMRQRRRAITGLDVGGGTITTCADGDLAVDWPRIVSDNLRIPLRPDRRDASSLADVSTALTPVRYWPREHYRAWIAFRHLPT